jgi:hypothetical protein
VKTPASIVIAVAVVGALATRAPVHAQPAGEPVAVDERADPLAVDDDGNAWNRGVPVVLRREARTLFLEGNRLFWIPLFARAAEHYSAALRKWKHPAFYFNLALAELNLGQQVEAREHFAQAVQHGAEPLGTERFQEAMKQRADLERQLGQIAISCSTAGAEVTLDGEDCDSSDGADSPNCNGNNPDMISSARCKTSRCGDLYTNPESGELCDEGDDTRDCNGNRHPQNSCRPSRCGDGYLNTTDNEECEANSDCPSNKRFCHAAEGDCSCRTS